MINSTTSSITLLYLLVVGIVILLAIEAISKKKSWSSPALLVYATTTIWYLAEPLYSPQNLAKFQTDIVDESYFQIGLFLIAFRFFLYLFCRSGFTLEKATLKYLRKNKFYILKTSVSKLLYSLLLIWGILAIYGIYRMGGNIEKALFPIEGRAGVHMWGRGAAASAGSTGFIVSSASYIYFLVCSFFGILLPFPKPSTLQIVNILLILVSWPYYVLMGGRKQLLGLILSFLFSYLFFSSRSVIHKFIFFVFVVFITNEIFSIIIAYRNIGFSEPIQQLLQGQSIENSTEKHLGLNMLEELCYIIQFTRQGALNLKYGIDYLIELLNVVPRVIWPNKPLINIDYAILRGFGRAGSDIGVFATISPGLIGQGILNFGLYLGPLAPAFLMSLWCRILTTLQYQVYSLPRICLFLASLGVTLSLGRGISLLTLWPIVFGYFVVRLLEKKD
jgi:hypothetical protein